MNTNVIEIISKVGKFGKKFSVEFANRKMYLVFSSESDAEDVNISCGQIASFNGYYNAIEIDPADLT